TNSPSASARVSRPVVGVSESARGRVTSLCILPGLILTGRRARQRRCDFAVATGFAENRWVALTLFRRLVRLITGTACAKAPDPGGGGAWSTRISGCGGR